MREWRIHSTIGLPMHRWSAVKWRAVHPWGAAWIALWVGFWVSPSPLDAQVRDLDLPWRTLRTEHFEIHYHEPLGVLARRLARLAERTRRRLAPLLGTFSGERVQVVLSDGTDSANGSATVLPRAEVRILASPPEDLSFLETYEDWMELLLVHEQSHVVHLGRVSGLPALVNALIGRWWVPNAAAPNWLLEGMATWQETARTGQGRLRDPLVSMVLRADALEGRQPSFAELSGALDRWPRGHLAYLYGGHFVDFVARRCGESFWRRFTEMAGRQVVPYAINRYAHRLCGATFQTLYQRFLASWRRQARATSRRRLRAGLREGRRLTFHGERTRRPRFVAPDQLGYVVADGRSNPALRLIRWPTSESLGDPVRLSGQASFAPSPSGGWVLSRLEPLRDIYAFHDLVRFDPSSGATRRLTRGLRARDPDVSPNGRLVVFVRESAGTRHLVLADVSDVEGTQRLLLRSERFGQVYCPRFSPDGRSVAFSWRRPGRGRDVAWIELHGGPVHLLTDDAARDGCPVWSPDGRHLIFSSTRDGGIADLYAWPLGSRGLLRLTRVRTGAFHPEPSPDGRSIVYVGYTSRGFDLFAVPFDPEAAEHVPLRALAPPRGRDVRASGAEEAHSLRSSPYEPLQTMGPRYWRLDYRSLGVLGLGPELTVRTDGGDVVGFHRYELTVRAPLAVRVDPSLELSWRVRRRTVPWGLYAWHRVEARGGLSVGGRRRRWLGRSLGIDVSADYTFRGTFSSHWLFGGASVGWLGKAAPFGGRLDPNDPPPRLPQRGWGSRLRVGWRWSNVTRQPWDISESFGSRTALSVRWSEPALGGRERTLAVQWAVSGFLRAPWHRLHVLALRYGGGMGGGWGGASAPVFSVGGFPERPLLDVVLGGEQTGGVALRGHPPAGRFGSQFHLGQFEWRFPLLRPMAGWATLPLFLRRLWGTLFVDVGDAFDGSFEPLRLAVGLGAQVHADVLLGYHLPLSLRAGFAWGVGEGGGPAFYFHAGRPF